MALYLVRHAHAGSRSRWDGDDDSLRPLTDKGHRQAAALADRLASGGVTRLLSSPFDRCRQTIEPLAAATSLPIELVDVLREGRPFWPVIELLASLPEQTVMCSHGDVIPDTINALMRRGMQLDGKAHWGKASVWVLERGDMTAAAVTWDVPSGQGIARATAWPPPELRG